MHPRKSIIHIILFFLNLYPLVVRAQSSLSFANQNVANHEKAIANNNISVFPLFTPNNPADKSDNLFATLKNQGINFGINEDLEGYYNFTGGIRIGSAYASTFDANVSVDLDKLMHIPGATFYLDLEDHLGDNPTDKLVGDFQVFDKHNAAPFFQALELWYQQELFNNKLRIKVGKIDANSEFSVIDNGLPFINSSTQVTPTFFVFPTFPDPVPSVNIFFNPDKLFFTDFAIDDANRSDHFLNFYGDPTSVQPSLHGELVISESGLNWDKIPLLKKDGNLKIGFWGHTGTFTKFDGSSQDGAKGAYAIFDQTLYRPSPDEDKSPDLGMFLEYAITEKNISPVYQHFGAGLLLKGFLEKRREDATGFTIHYTNLSLGLNGPKDYELNMETFYKFRITDWMSIKSDFQYIVNPGGKFGNALVGTLLLNIAFNS
jgi:porin